MIRRNLLLCLSALTVCSEALTPGFLHYSDLQGQPYTVSYTNRSIVVNGTPTIFISGTMHYARMLPSQYNDVMVKAVNDGGSDAIDPYESQTMLSSCRTKHAPGVLHVELALPSSSLCDI
jgi:hypothetical protein